MVEDDKGPNFSPSDTFEPGTHEPHAVASLRTAKTDVGSLANLYFDAATILSDTTICIPFKLQMDSSDNGHNLFFGTTREARDDTSGVRILSREVLLAIGSLRATAEASGISLRDLAQQVYMPFTPRGYKVLREAVEKLIADQALDGLWYSEEDGLVRVDSVAQ